MTISLKTDRFLNFVARLSGLAVLALTVSIEPAYAYLDPGTGSMILQLLIGGVAGALVVGKLYYVKIKTFIGDLFGRPQTDQNTTDKD